LFWESFNGITEIPKNNIWFYQTRRPMSPTQEGTTLILASIAVCLMIYAMNQQYGRSSPRALGASKTIGEKASGVRKKITKKFNDFFNAKKKKKNKEALGARRARVDPTLDCSDVSPSDPNWTRCAQGSAVGRIPTTNATNAVSNFTLDFARDNATNQGLGSRLQDGFVQDQFRSDASTNLGSRNGPRGMKIDTSNLKNNAFFSQGTENASTRATSGLSTQGAAAFPFSRRSDGADESDTATRASRAPTGPVPGTEALGMGMRFEEFARGPRHTPLVESSGRPMGKREALDEKGHGTRRQSYETKPSDEPVGNAFNPFVDTPSAGLGAGLKISEAFGTQPLGCLGAGAGSTLTDAFKTGALGAHGALGAAVSPVSSDVGVSPEEISAATASLEDVNIVQSTIGGQLNFGIRP
jgi:hypothetical protein